MNDDWNDNEQEETIGSALNLSETTQVAQRMPFSDEPVVDKSMAHLVILTGRTAGKSYSFEDNVLLGRGADADLRISDDSVSRRHARISKVGFDKDEYVVEDQESRNGTFVNGIAVDRLTLKTGDKIRLGSKTVLLFTRRRPLEEAFLQSQRMEALGKLARGIAHDFNNLLSTAILCLEYVEGVMEIDEPLDREDVQDTIKSAKKALNNAAELTDQLLRFSRSGRVGEHSISISDLLKETVGLVRRTFDRAIQIDAKFEEKMNVVGDRSQLHQVLMNLFINARDAMPEGGHLNIKARLRSSEKIKNDLPLIAPGLYVEVMVSDNGIGMDQETKLHAFDPFFTTKAPGKGTGLGLATVYGIVKNHGGQIRIESEVDRGTTFWVYLPASERPTEERVTSNPTNASVEARSGVIMIVDDETLLTNSTRKLLELRGHEVLCCANGIEAIDCYEKEGERIDLVLLDIVMPEMGGLEALKELKKMDPAIKVLIISGYAEERQIYAAHRMGILGFLQKPVDAEKLCSEISMALG